VLSTRNADGMGTLVLELLRIRVHVQQGMTERAKELLSVLPSHDITYLAARSGPSDLLRAQIHLLEGQLREAAWSAHAAVEGLEYWNQHFLLPSALAVAEYVAVLRGDGDAADDYHVRFESLPRAEHYVEYRWALVHHLVARRLRTGETDAERELRALLDQAHTEGAHGVEALIRFTLFRHFGEAQPEEMCRLADLGSDLEFTMLRELGPALRDRDARALLRFAKARETSMPDLAARCRAMAPSFRGGSGPAGAGVRARGTYGIGVELTARERQIGRYLVDGLSNTEIAERLGVAVRTIEGHTYRLYRKLGITSRAEVAGALADLRRRTSSD
jgi:ATP/maltotriose-dependent transcriptional regulator MalT